MENSVAAFPVVKLWRDGRELAIKRLRDVVRDEVENLLLAGPVQIVVAQTGAKLLWIAIESGLGFWKRTPKSAYYRTISFHGQGPDYSVPMSYLFYPSVWECLDGIPVVLLEGVFWPTEVRGAGPM